MIIIFRLLSVSDSRGLYEFYPKTWYLGMTWLVHLWHQFQSLTTGTGFAELDELIVQHMRMVQLLCCVATTPSILPHIVFSKYWRCHTIEENRFKHNGAEVLKQNQNLFHLLNNDSFRIILHFSMAFRRKNSRGQKYFDARPMKSLSVPPVQQRDIS